MNKIIMGEKTTNVIIKRVYEYISEMQAVDVDERLLAHSAVMIADFVYRLDFDKILEEAGTMDYLEPNVILDRTKSYVRGDFTIAKFYEVTICACYEDDKLKTLAQVTPTLHDDYSGWRYSCFYDREQAASSTSIREEISRKNAVMWCAKYIKEYHFERLFKKESE